MSSKRSTITEEYCWTGSLAKAFRAGSEWSDKDELLDVVYWGKQVLSLIVGITFGAVSMHGILAIVAYIVISTVVAQNFVVKYQQVDEDEVGGFWELAKEGFGSAFATFMVSWITVYSAVHHNSSLWIHQHCSGFRFFRFAYNNFISVLCLIIVHAVTFIILGQRSSYDNLKAKSLAGSLYNQCKSLGKKVAVLVPHNDSPEVHGFWAIWPLLNKIVSLVESDWYVFLESDSRVNADILFDFLKDFDPFDKFFIGHGLMDAAPTIIHHFYGFDNVDDSKFLFPDFTAGVVFSKGLITNLTKAIETAEQKKTASLFTIDAKHELALLVYKMSGVLLLSNPKRFCLSQTMGCAIFYQESFCVPENEASYDELFVAVKTYSGNHDTRRIFFLFCSSSYLCRLIMISVPVIKSLWASLLPYIVFFSDVANAEIPTIDSGVPNTEREIEEEISFASLEVAMLILET
ncbi:Rab5-interacting protein [Dictyocaulus viviparus]|uniref:Rab5-interacting protein n=1 Tax=Dictyocaulus viviparus TaxID=29172 RepID=A0A0D8XRA2_DICVI|nr:Rab5-interacting protein [Dictyocaulus viviparus]